MTRIKARERRYCKSGKKIVLLALLLLCCGGWLLAGCGGGDPPGQSPAEEIAQEEPTYCPLDHQVVTGELPSRPLVVTIDNQAKARPQSGISQADIMYEIPAEGGISRFLAIFYHTAPEVIGPVRSARPYLVDIAKEWKGLYVHAGGSPDALDYLARGDWPYVNEFAYGKDFWRDKSRKAPHNLYTSSENLRRILADKGWDVPQQLPGFTFLTEDEVLAGEAADVIKIKYPAARDTYTYDPVQKVYLREINEEPHVDAANQQQLAPANVLVQKVTSKVLDSEGRLAIDMVGQGEAMLFTQGQVFTGVWSRRSLDQATVFQDQAGGYWRLTPGQTWIQVIDQQVKISYENTQAVPETAE